MAAPTSKRRPKKAASQPTLDARKPRPLAAPAQRVTKTTDSKGRVALGGQFANRSVIVEKLSETEMVVKLARVIPESEAWLYDNAGALAAVRDGLAQARAGKVTHGPNLDADADFAAQLED